LTSTSPSSAIAIVTPGTGRPTVPMRLASGVFTAAGAAVSVTP
jgi:hypothetical protein